MRKAKSFSLIIITLLFSSILLAGLSPDFDESMSNQEERLSVDNIIKQSFRNTNDWSASGNAANPAVMNSIDTSSNNEIVVAGIISGSTTMTMGSSSITSGQFIEPWIGKADSNGNWQWITKVSITGTSQYAEATLQDISVAPNGDIFATGMFYDSISFGSISLTSTGYWDCWTAKLSPNGQWQWAQALRLSLIHI